MRNYAAFIYKPGIGWVRRDDTDRNEPGEADPRQTDWREDSPSWMRPQSPAGRLFDVLSRFNYASANMGLEGGRIVRDDKDDSVLGGAGRVLGAGWRGLSGQDKVFWEDAIRESDWGKKEQSWLPTVLGLAADIGLDPTTYLSFGATKLGKAGKLAKMLQGGAQFADTPKGIKAARLVGRAVTKTGQSADELADIWKAGKAAQSAAGMRGLQFAGKQIAAPTGYYKWAERLPKFLAGSPDVIQGSKLYSGLERNVPGLRRAANEIGRAFTPGDTMLPWLRKLGVGSKRTGQVAEARMGQELPELSRMLRGIEPEQVAQFTHAYEKGGPEAIGELAGALGRGNVDEVLEKMHNIFDGIEATERAAYEAVGVDMALLADPDLSAHLLHMFDPDAKAFIGKTPQGQRLLRRVHGMQDPGQFMRTLKRGHSIYEINGLAASDLGAVLGPDFAGMTVPRLLIDDPVQLATIRAGRAGRVVDASEWLNGVRRFLAPLDEAGANLIEPQLTATVGNIRHNPLTGWKGDPWVVGEIERVWNLVRAPEAQGQLLRMWDVGLNTWRGYALMAPSYHVRNLFSNMWQNFIGGVDDPRAYSEALQFQIAAKRSAKDGGEALRAFKVATPFGDVTGDQLHKMLFDEDLLGGFMSEWQTELARLEEGRQLGKLRGANDAAQKFNLALGGNIENNARVALFMNELKKGSDAADAAAKVRHFLFDYTPTGLSHFESTKLRRLTSFYRWTKNNMLLSTEQLVKQPGKYAGIPKVKHAIEGTLGQRGGTPPPETYLPEWLSEGYAVRTRGGDSPQYFSLQNWLPAMQVAELFEDIDEVPVPGLQWAMGMLAPGIAIPLEQTMNRSLFFEKPIQEYPGERRDFLGVPMSPRLSHVLRAARPLSEINRFTKGAPTGEAIQALFTGRTYPYDYRKEQRSAKFRKVERLGHLTRAWKRALIDRNQREADRLKQLILETRRTQNVQ